MPTRTGEVSHTESYIYVSVLLNFIGIDLFIICICDIYRVKGISLQELRDELLAGNRLPRPESCPSRMSCLIQRCFSYEANDRPSFREIKKLVMEAFEDLGLNKSTSAERNEGDEEVLHYADLQLQNRYLEMKVKNNDYQQNKTKHDRHVFTDDRVSSTTCSQNITLDVQARTSFYRKDEDTYLSMIDNNGAPFRSRRSSSYGGGDPTPLLQPERLARAKTSPNPLYMLNLSNREDERLAIDEIFKRLKSLDG